MKPCKKIVALGLSGALLFAVPMNAAAEAKKPENMDEATWIRLQDNVLEYDEIRDLVENYNPTYLQVVGNIEANTVTFLEAAKELRNYAEVRRSK